MALEHYDTIDNYIDHDCYTLSFSIPLGRRRGRVGPRR